MMSCTDFGGLVLVSSRILLDLTSYVSTGALIASSCIHSDRSDSLYADLCIFLGVDENCDAVNAHAG